ncbi:MAG TPA: hypothetical protein VEK08_20280 [Planctomycetota bacterium]|nr:hypothetical protein [Planctomycetota bacterium]
MSVPVNLSDELVSTAQQEAAAKNRSLADQIELWAALGKLVATEATRPTQSLHDCLMSVDTPAGREKLRQYLASRPYPHFEAIKGKSGEYIRIDADGTRTQGRFVDGSFQTTI